MSIRCASGSRHSRARLACAAATCAFAASGLATASAAAAAPSPAAGPAASASSACITRLPLMVRLPSRFTIYYKRVIRLQVTTRVPLIRNLRISLYTFSGDLLGSGSRSSLQGSGVVRLRLRYRLEPGSYTLYSEGEPNADPSCGPKNHSRVVRFRGCITTLPVSFPALPGGEAAEYGRYLPFRLASKGPLIRRLQISVTSSEGTPFGTTGRAVLFGTVLVEVPLTRDLAPGTYTLTVRGWIASQPTACGPKHAEQVLTFT